MIPYTWEPGILAKLLKSENPSPEDIHELEKLGEPYVSHYYRMRKSMERHQVLMKKIERNHKEIMGVLSLIKTQK